MWPVTLAISPATSRRLWAGAIVTTLVWIATASALLAFSNALPELERTYNRSATFSTLLVPVGVTLLALLLPKRSARRTLTAYMISVTLASLLVAQDYWRQRRYYTPERLAAARRDRMMEIVRRRQNDREFDEAVTAARLPPAASASARP